MFKQKDILDEKNKTLRQISKEVTFPLDKEDKDLIYDMIKYLELSQDDEYASKHNIRGGMGLSFVQLGKLKRIFVIANKIEKDEENDEPDEFIEHIIINPKLISHSEEQVYVEEGEGCLSINRETIGIVPRYARITVEYQDVEGNKQTVRVREEIAIAFQHEMDHLDGILFVDKIDPKDPFKNKDNMRSI